MSMEALSVVILAMPNAMALDIIGPSDVFHNSNRVKEMDGVKGAANYKVFVVSVTRELAVRTSSGLVISCDRTIYDIDFAIDTLIVGGFSMEYNWDSLPELVAWLRKRQSGIRRIASICLGAFLLAQAGLLHHKMATTHWSNSKDLETLYSGIDVKLGPIFIKDGNIYTSAGASAGIDLSLALVEEDNGRPIAVKIAKLLVLYLKRTGSQPQVSDMLLDQEAIKRPIYELQEWIKNNLTKNLNNTLLAEKSMMSERNFARVFRFEIGSTPAKYVEKVRVESARRYLEYSNEPLERIAANCGFKSLDTMRKIFLRVLKMTPHFYRKHFGQL